MKTDKENESLKNIYDRVFSSNEKFFSFDPEIERNSIIESMNWNGKNILEIGCGTGELSREISERYEVIRITGIDYSASAIEKSIQNGNEKCEYHYLNILEDFEKIESMGPFDIVVMQGVLEHFEKPYDLMKMIVENLVKDGGELVSSSPSFINLRGYIWMTLQILFNVPMSLTDVSFIDPMEMETFLEKYGRVHKKGIYHSVGEGIKITADFNKRLRNALRDVNLYDRERVDKFLDYLNNLNKNYSPFHTNYSGAMTVYILEKR